MSEHLSIGRALCLAVVLTICVVGHTTADMITTGNLLRNPGGEDGVATPWSLSGQGSQTTFENEPASLPGGTVNANEGDFWFKSDRTFGSTFSRDGALIGVIADATIIRQTVDVQSLPRVTSVELGADFFGVGEILGGDTVRVEMQPLARLRFLDSAGDFINGDSGFPISEVVFFGGQFDMTGAVRVQNDLRRTVNSIPAGTAYLDVEFKNDLKIVYRDTGHGRGILGIDDAFLAVTVPEPSTLCLASFCTVMLIGYLRLAQTR